LPEGEGQSETIAPDKMLEKLYKSSRPAVELLPGVNLSPVINACWLKRDAKAMLAETWIPAPPEGEEEAAPAPPAPSFDPSSIDYSELQKRLSKSAPLRKWNELTVTIRTLEITVERTRDFEEKEAKSAELEAARASLAETEAQLTELKASFQEDPLALVPWMSTLFELADAGLTTFDVSGPFFPYAVLRNLFGGDNTLSYFEGAEAILGIFKKRYEKERGAGRIQVLTKLLPNIFQDGYSPALLEPLVDKMRTTLYGEESVEPLDFLQLYWWDPKEHEVLLATLKALQKLSEDKLEINEESGDATVAEPKKVRGLGLVDFPPRAIVTAIQAGVPVTAVSIPFSVADRSHAKALQVCREYNIKVLSRDGLMGGLINEKYLGMPPPETTQTDPDLDDVAYALDMANNYGGWAKLQGLLHLIKGIADKHSVKMATVALRWQIDQGTFPIATARWAPNNWRQFGFRHWDGVTPGVDWQLFQVDSFLDPADMKALNVAGA